MVIFMKNKNCLVSQCPSMSCCRKKKKNSEHQPWSDLCVCVCLSLPPSLSVFVCPVCCVHAWVRMLVPSFSPPPAQVWQRWSVCLLWAAAPEFRLQQPGGGAKTEPAEGLQHNTPASQGQNQHAFINVGQTKPNDFTGGGRGGGGVSIGLVIYSISAVCSRSDCLCIRVSDTADCWDYFDSQ